MSAERRETPSPEETLLRNAAIEPEQGSKTVRRLLVGIFLLMLVGALYFAQDFLLPVALAFLFAMVLSPVVRWLRHHGIPAPATALALVAVLFLCLASALYFLSGPVTDLIRNAPGMAHEIRDKIAALRGPVEAISEASDQVEQLANGGADPDIQRVVISEPGLLSRAASGAPEIGAKIGLTFILLLFLLASGDLFYEKLIRALPTLSDKKRAVRIVRDVEREVSRYLLTISVINLGVGIAVGAGMFFLAMPTPVIWGLLAALLNYIPYIGPLLGMVTVGAVGIVSLDTLGDAALAPIVYFIVIFIEGQLITPLVLGRRLELNEVSIFIAVAFWGWLWGIVGALLAVPFLVVFKTFADHVDSLRPFGEFLSARHSADDVAPAKAEAAEAAATGESG
jgi:predicted PurR-regulated permease PerM